MISDRTTPSAPQTYLPVYNATGSVTALMRAADTTLVATYEYDPAGNLLRATGDYAKQNPFTHAGGWLDWETGLINAGSTYYSPRLARCINTAPSGSGSGLYACFGVACTRGYFLPRRYAQPPARRARATIETGIIGWIEPTPEQWTAYQAAMIAYEKEVAIYENAMGTWQDEQHAKTIFVEGRPYSERDNLDNLDASYSHEIGYGTDFNYDQPERASVYLEKTINYRNGDKLEIYDDGSALLLTEDGRALPVEAGDKVSTNLNGEVFVTKADGTTIRSVPDGKSRQGVATFGDPIFVRYEDGSFSGGQSTFTSNTLTTQVIVSGANTAITTQPATIDKNLQNASLVRQAALTGLGILDPTKDQTGNITVGDKNFAQVKDPSAINTTGWTPQKSIHGTAIESPPIPGYTDYAVKLYNDPDRGNIIAVVHPTQTVTHYFDAVLYILGSPVNANTANSFLNSNPPPPKPPGCN